MTIQFVRFFWKRESNQKAKILRVFWFSFLFLLLIKGLIFSHVCTKGILFNSKYYYMWHNHLIWSLKCYCDIPFFGINIWFMTCLKCVLRISESGLPAGVGCLWFLFWRSSQKIGRPSSGICVSFVPVSFILSHYSWMVTKLLNSQKLRDEEGKKLGLKGGEKSSNSKDNDVKMTEAEVI